MKNQIKICIYIAFLIIFNGCTRSNAYDFSMISPEATMESYYNTLKYKKYEDFKRLFTSGGFIMSEIRFNELSDLFEGYTIIKNIQIADETSKHEKRFIQIEVKYSGYYDLSIMNYILIMENKLWKIESYDAVEATNEDPEEIKKQLEEIFK